MQGERKSKEERDKSKCPASLPEPNGLMGAERHIWWFISASEPGLKAKTTLVLRYLEMNVLRSAA